MRFFYSFLLLIIGFCSSNSAMQQLQPLQKIASAESYLSPKVRKEILESRLALLHSQSPDPGTAEEIGKTRALINLLDDRIKQQQIEQDKMQYVTGMFPGDQREVHRVYRERIDSSSSDSSSDDGACPDV